MVLLADSWPRYPFDHVFGPNSVEDKATPLIMGPIIDDLFTYSKPSTLLSIGGAGSAMWLLGNDLTSITALSLKGEK